MERWADRFIDRLLDEEPAILLEGPRGSGKSTLLRSIAHRRNALVLDLDDDSVLQLVREDVGSALASPGLVAIDEFHRAPEVLSYVKRVVDRQGGTARFLLAGSVSSFLLPPGTETLTGRAHRLSLMPLAAAEVFGAKDRWLAALLAAGEPRTFRTTLERSEVFDVVAAGGYPAALRRATPARRTRWFASYLTTVTDRDLPDLIDVRHSGALSRFYRLIAQRTSSMAVNTRAVTGARRRPADSVLVPKAAGAPLPDGRVAGMDRRSVRQDRVWRFVLEGPDGGTVGMSGEYREIVPVERTVHTEAVDEYPGDSVVTILLTEDDGKTTLAGTVLYESHEVRDAVIESGMEHGAAETYDRRAELLPTLT
ncbi:MAG: AAA family ATPase [Ilumatobacteraceae bacterium]